MDIKFNRKQFMAKECDHWTYWNQFATERLKSAVLQVIGAERLKASTDPYMNDIPMELWDSISLPANVHKAICVSNASTTQGGVLCSSSSDQTCAVKAAGRLLKAELENQPELKIMSGILQALQATASEIIAKDSQLFRKQKYTTPWRIIEDTKCRAFIRFDDECGNRHNTFAITGETRDFYDSRWHGGSFGCVHEEVEKFFPELAPFIKWHHTSSDGPMHYIGNTVYHAGDKDCWGRRKGDVASSHKVIRPQGSPFTRPVSDGLLKFIEAKLEHMRTTLPTNPDHGFKIIEVPHEDKPGDTFDYGSQYTFEGYEKPWSSCPFNSLVDAQEMLAAITMPHTVEVVATSWSKGKERDLDAARNSAVWPDATDEELMADDLKEKLEARHEKLCSEFKADILKLGLLWEPQT